MKNKLMKVLITLATVFAFVIPSVTATTTTYADDVNNESSNAIWEKSSAQYGNLNQVQPLHNGNEIYYSIKTPSNNGYYRIWQIAANKWNQLGVIKLVQVPVGDARSQITLSGTYHYVTQRTINRIMARDHPGDNAVGATNASYFPTPVGPNQDHDYMTQTSAQLYPSLWACNLNITIKIAEHELGHCLGFEHSTHTINGRHVIMNEYTSSNTLPLGNYEKNLLLQNYGEFLNQNNDGNSTSDQSSTVENSNNG